MRNLISHIRNHLLISVNSPISLKTHIHTFSSDCLRLCLVIIPIHCEQNRTTIIIPERDGKISCHACQKTPNCSSLTSFFARYVRHRTSRVYFLSFRLRANLIARVSRAKFHSRSLVPLARDWIQRRHAHRPSFVLVHLCDDDVYDLWLLISGESVVFARERAPIAKSHTAPRCVVGSRGPSPVLWDHGGPHSRCPFIANYGRSSLEIRPTVNCNPLAVPINFDMLIF